MPAEDFFVPTDGVPKLTLTQLEAALTSVALSAVVTKEEGQSGLEFPGFESRLLVSPEDGPLDLITLQVYGELMREAPIIEKIGDLLDRHGYVSAEQFPDAENA